MDKATEEVICIVKDNGC